MKPTKFVISALIALLVRAPAPAQTAVPKSDTQNWNDVYLNISLSKKVDFVVHGTLRMGNDLRQPADERWGLGWVFNVNKYLSFNPFYFHREARAPHGKSEYEDRFTLGVTLQESFRKFTLIDRNLFERRWREPQVNAWRYRQRIRLEHPFQIGQAKFSWFVSDEVFYDWSLHQWVRNRAALGAAHSFNKHFAAELYYMRQNDGRTRPGDINIIGTTFRFRR
jgi:hypothetical protein